MNRKVSNKMLILLIISTLTILTACGNSDKGGTNSGSVNSSSDSMQLVISDYDESNLKAEPTGKITWEKLANSNNYKSTGFRSNIDKIFNINKVTVVEDGKTVDSKQGCMYNIVKDDDEIQYGNTTFRDAMRNETFIKYINNPGVLKNLSDSINMTFKDVDKNSDSVIRATLNGYFNLMSLKDNEENYNPNQELTRAQFYSTIYRAGNRVEDIDETEFDNPYMIYASKIEDNALVKLDDSNMNEPITKLEAYYLVTTLYFPDYVEMVDFDKNTTAFGYKNAEDLVSKTGLTDNYKLLAYMSNNQSNGIDANILKVLTTAERLGFSSGLRAGLFTPINKDETIRLLMNVFNTENSIRGYLTKVEYGKMVIPVYEYEDPVEYDETIDLRFDEPVVLSEDKIKFNGDAATYVDEAAAIEVLTPIAQYMVEHPTLTLLLVGSTAGDDNTDSTIKLSQDRADAVKQTLIGMGAKEYNILTLGLGCDDPWHIKGVGTQGEEAAKNRKVVLMDVLSKDAKHLLGLDEQGDGCTCGCGNSTDSCCSSGGCNIGEAEGNCSCSNGESGACECSNNLENCLCSSEDGTCNCLDKSGE